MCKDFKRLAISKQSEGLPLTFNRCLQKTNKVNALSMFVSQRMEFNPVKPSGNYMYHLLYHYHLRVCPLYSGFPSPKTKFRHLSLSLVSSSVSPWFVLLHLFSIHVSVPYSKILWTKAWYVSFWFYEE
jgi:hypothetical protein